MLKVRLYTTMRSILSCLVKILVFEFLIDKIVTVCFCIEINTASVIS